MSVLVITKVAGDTTAFRQALAQRGGEFAKFAESAKAAGAIHHRFGIGDGYVVVVDEWESPSAFESFMSDPELQRFIASAGAAAGPPDVMITEAVRSPDEF